MKKVLAMALAAIMSIGLLAGCGASKEAPKSETTPAPKADTQKVETKAPEKEVIVKVLQLKVEIVDALKKVEDAYAKENPGKQVKVETVGGGADYAGALMAKFQSGDAPDIFVSNGYADLDKWLEKSEDLTDQPWVKDMVDGAAIPISKDGKIYGLPFAVEGFGFAYNKALFKKAGIETLPNTLTTLEDAAKKLQAAGIQPFSNSYAEWWALGLHNMNVPLAHQTDAQKFIDDVAAGKAKFKDNPVTAGWIKLLDLTVKYGQKNPTTAGDYTSSVAAFSSSKAAMIQQGNWIQPDLDKVDQNLDVGFLPMPISDTPDEKINVGVPNYWNVNKESKQKDEAKAFLTWLVTSDTGRTLLTEEAKVVPAFKSIKSASAKGLNAALSEYAAAGKTYSWEFPRLPSGSGELIGAVMMKYLGQQITADEMSDTIDKAIIDKAAAKIK